MLIPTKNNIGVGGRDDVGDGDSDVDGDLAPRF